jgi:hypothetical protein
LKAATSSAQNVVLLVLGNHGRRIHTMRYNFVRIHQTLRCTSAMTANVTPKLWELADMVKVLED